MLAALLRANGKSLLLHQHFILSNEVLEGVRYMAVFVAEICLETEKASRSCECVPIV